MVIGVMYAFISAFSFGISNAYWKRASDNDEFSRIVFFRSLMTSLLFGLCWLILPSFLDLPESMLNSSVDTQEYHFTILLCLVCSFGLVFYLQSLRFESVAVSVALSNINIASILTAVFVFQEKFQIGYAISFLLSGIGLWWISTSKAGPQRINNGVLYSLLASLIWGISYALFRYPAGWMGALPLAFILEFCVMTVAFLWNVYFYRKTAFSIFNVRPTAWKHYFILAGLLCTGTLFFNLAIQRIEILYLNLTGNLSVITPVLLSFFWFKEGLTKRQWIGILAVLIALIIAQILH